MERYQFSAEEQWLIERMPQPLAVYQIFDEKIELCVLSDGFCKLHDYQDREDAIHNIKNDLFGFVHPDDVIRVRKASKRFAKDGGTYDIYYRTRQRTGSEYMVIHANGEIVYTESGIRLGYVWYTNEGIYASDEDGRSSVFRHSIYNALHEESLVNASHYDVLTELPQMTYFFELAEKWKDGDGKEEKHASMLYFNLLGMKNFNAENGFAEGDALLRGFANLLEEMFSRNHCCHIAADQFAVFSSDAELEVSLEKLISACRELNGGKTLPVHIGIYPDMLENDSVSAACDCAKLACDTMKSSFESGICYYDNNLKERELFKQYILSHLDQAIKEKWIQVYFQALVRAVNGRVCNEEALSRWVDPERGIIPPNEYIPFLEAAGIIYKLDLCVVEQVLEKLRLQKEAGCVVVPQTVNLSRTDFDACDIVEEIRKRVDSSEFERNMIVIEITESVVGSDADYMKTQINRFRELGFSVWLDDFGSGYSSLEVLQSIRVDLLKFDMSFMRRLDEGEEGKIILTELLRMASALGIDTACEGVEKEEQARFLRDAGCSKLQGYYYSKPVSLEALLKRYKEGLLIGFENPAEEGYYETIGKANLHDLGIIAKKENDALRRAFDSLPMCILEVGEGIGFFMRSNQSYRDFMSRLFAINLSEIKMNDKDLLRKPSDTFLGLIQKCTETDDPVILDEELPDGSVIHSFARKIAENPEKKRFAIAVAVLSISDAAKGTTYADIARALAADYYNIYHVDLDTEQFIEYSSPIGGQELAMERHGENFFASVKMDATNRIYEGDREAFLNGFTKENILKELDRQGTFNVTYRLIDTGIPTYVNMKIMRSRKDGNALIIGISVVDSQMKQQEQSRKQERELHAYARVMALTGDYVSLYTVEADTGKYTEYTANEDYEKLGLMKQGEDFFRQSRIDVEKVVYPEDLETVLQNFTKENILREIRENHQFQMHYRLMLNGVPRPVSLKIVSVHEQDGDKLLAGVRAWRERS